MGAEGGDGSVAEMGGWWWAKREGGAKMAMKGIEEGGIGFVLHEVWFVVT